MSLDWSPQNVQCCVTRVPSAEVPVSASTCIQSSGMLFHWSSVCRYGSHSPVSRLPQWQSLLRHKLDMLFFFTITTWHDFPNSCCWNKTAVRPLFGSPIVSSSCCKRCWRVLWAHFLWAASVVRPFRLFGQVVLSVAGEGSERICYELHLLFGPFYCLVKLLLALPAKALSAFLMNCICCSVFFP